MSGNSVHVLITTSFGPLKVELDAALAPATVENFLEYVRSGFYENTIFHRVINGFVIQGGGFDAKMTQKKTNPTIKNEASNGLKNDRGTLSMARTNDPNSATSQFFINLQDNAFLNPGPGNPGYAVFGKVIEGMDVVDRISRVKTGRFSHYTDVPVDPVILESIKLLDEEQA